MAGGGVSSDAFYVILLMAAPVTETSNVPKLRTRFFPPKYGLSKFYLLVFKHCRVFIV